MSAMDTNGLPPVPEGYIPPETVTPTPEMGIVPVREMPITMQHVATLGYVGCVLAGVCAPVSTLIASAVAGYATMLLTGVQGIKPAAAASGLGVLASIVCGLFLGVDLIPAALVTLLIACAMGMGLGTGRLTSGGLCAMCVVATLVYMGIDACFAVMAKTNLNDLMMDQFSSAFAELSENLGSSGASLDTMLLVLGYLWPSGYTLHTLICMIAAALGTRLARSGPAVYAPRTLTFTVFDLPLWVAGVLLASIVGFTLAQIVPSGDVVMKVAANAAVAVRCAFGISGVAVAAWFLRRRGMSVMLTLVIAGILVFIDLQFFVMAIVGLVDFWANFRHLSRGGKTPEKKA